MKKEPMINAQNNRVNGKFTTPEILSLEFVINLNRRKTISTNIIGKRVTTKVRKITCEASIILNFDTHTTNTRNQLTEELIF